MNTTVKKERVRPVAIPIITIPMIILHQVCTGVFGSTIHRGIRSGTMNVGIPIHTFGTIHGTTRGMVLHSLFSLHHIGGIAIIHTTMCTRGDGMDHHIVPGDTVECMMLGDLRGHGAQREVKKVVIETSAEYEVQVRYQEVQ